MANPAWEPTAVVRHCVRCGQLGLARRTDEGWACPACGLVLFLNVAAAAVAVIRDDDGRVLLVRRAHEPRAGKLDLPGGFVGDGETAEAALLREVREEVGLEIEDIRYLASFVNVYPYRGLNYRTLDLYFACRALDLSLLRAGDEVTDCQFLSPASIPDEDIAFASVRQAIRRAMS